MHKFIFLPQSAFAAVISVSGTVYSNAGTTTIADGTTVRLLVNGAAAQTTTTTAGAYTFAAVTSVSGDIISLNISGVTQKGVTITRGIMAVLT